MQCIVSYPNNSVFDASCAEAKASYPISNVLNEHPKDIALSMYNNMTVVCGVSPNTNAFFSANCRGTYMDSIITWGGIEVEGKQGVGEVTGKQGVGEVTFKTNSFLLPTKELYDVDESGSGSIWIEYDSPDKPHAVQFSLTGADDYAQVGVVTAAEMRIFRGVLVGAREGGKDFSIVHDLADGSVDITDKSAVSTFEIEFVARRSSDIGYHSFYKFMHGVWKQVKKHPIAWKLSNSSDDIEWIRYMMFETEPSGEYISENGDWVRTRVRLREVL